MAKLKPLDERIISLFHHFHQLSKTVHYVVLNIARGKPLVHVGKELAGAFDLGLFDLPQVH